MRAGRGMRRENPQARDLGRIVFADSESVVAHGLRLALKLLLSGRRMRFRAAPCVLTALVSYGGLVSLLRLGWNVDLSRYWMQLVAGAGAGDIVILVFAGGGVGIALHQAAQAWRCQQTKASAGIPRLIKVATAERGMALVLTLGVTVVLTLSGASLLEFTTSNLRSGNDSNQRTLAYTAAERGLNDALSWLYNNSNQWHATSPITVGPVSAGLGGLTYTYTATPNFPIWTISSTGSAPNKTQGTGRSDTRTVSQQVRVQETSNGVDISIWNMYFSDAAAGTPSQCMHWNAIIEDPFYIRGDMCLDANGDSDPIPGWPPASLPGAAQLQVGGHIYITPPGHLGYGSNKLNIVQTGAGCALYNNGTPGATHNPCKSSDSILANQYLTGPPNMAKPTVDLATWYQDALPGPKHNCTSGSFPGGFDTDGTQNNSLGTVNLTPAGAYDCQFIDATGAQLGRVKWTPGSPGTLVINGTVFWDGNLVVGSSFTYQGRATFYFAGTVTLNSGVSVCGQAGCANSWNTSNNMLVLIAGSANQSPSWAVNAAATSKMQGGIEAVGDINQNNGATMWGGLIAHQLYNLSANDNWVPFNTATAGQPAQGAYQEGLGIVPGSYGG
jgi:Tfp pilus assembly protein PilX